ncbi:MAG: hypothetical protein IKD01_01650 [Oscillospiraceae bacterium]|nr:hypothetical protein [Oscillospiraceae bacterium]
MIGTAAEITLDLRGKVIDPESARPLSLDPAVFLDCESFFFAIDGDFEKKTSPLLLRTSGITPESSESGTYLKVTIENTAVDTLLAALGDKKSVEFFCEIAGLSAAGTANFSWIFPVTVRNRLFMGGDAPESVTSDPAYLTSAEVKAFVTSEVDEAIAGSGGSGITEEDKTALKEEVTASVRDDLKTYVDEKFAKGEW